MSETSSCVGLNYVSRVTHERRRRRRGGIGREKDDGLQVEEGTAAAAAAAGQASERKKSESAKREPVKGIHFVTLDYLSPLSPRLLVSSCRARVTRGGALTACVRAASSERLVSPSLSVSTPPLPPPPPPLLPLHYVLLLQECAVAQDDGRRIQGIGWRKAGDKMIELPEQRRHRE